ncbi:Flagellar biosynthesis protein, FliO [Methyloligella halotolerans]|uniref:Flagellar biosynthesis protein, FliO n=1 Tax=Methyloligella halotolerans TaxID=1177755 RepID=A0A1E2S3C3_9HYPH|nr:flagellar biosynthetic protein FliO [Methyloligella halotolerans]ODA68900.1 Flagellar biosynthesis protein, FliO [Methyloligella halotolerans]
MSDTSQLILVISTFLFVMALIALAVWGFKAFFSSNSSGPGFFRARERRLNVVESAVVDAKRKLYLIRRDDKEHLVMIGGPVDMVIETGIEARQPLDHPLEDVVIDHSERPQSDPELS